MPSKRVAWRVLSTWLLTLLVFAGGVAIYSYIYVQGRERTFTEKRLRELWLIGDRLKLRIENFGNSAIPRAVKAGQEEAPQPCTEKPDSSLSVLSNDGSAVPEQAKLRAACQYIAILPHTQLIPQFTLEKVVEYGVIPHTTTKSGIPGPSARVFAQGIGDTQELIFTFQSSGESAPYFLKWRGHIDVQSLLGSYGTDSFDQVLVIDSEGAVQFQIGPPRFAVTNLSSLLDLTVWTEKPGSAESTKGSPNSLWPVLSGSSSVSRVNVAGKEYLLFLQPVRISLIGSESVEQPASRYPLDWRIAGLISKDRFRNESAAFSYTVVVFLVFVFLVAICALPFLKIISLGPFDQLRKMDVVWLGTCSVMIVALSTLFLLDFYAYKNLQNQLDKELEQLAVDVNKHFEDDLDSLLSLLSTLSQRHVPVGTAGSRTNLLDVKKNEGRSSDEQAPDPRYVREAILKGAFLERIVWINPCGDQNYKWTISDVKTPLISVRERPYFKSVADDSLWEQKIRGSGPRPETVRFWIGPIESGNTGENIATISIPGPSSDEATLRQASEELHSHSPCSASQQGLKSWVIAIDAALPSLRNVVLPPDYGFVIVGEGGSVLFHSDAARHFRENLFDETNHEPVLEAAVLGRTEESFDAEYLGTGHRFYVKHMEHPPWTVITFRNNRPFRTTNLEILALSLFLFLLMILAQIPVIWMLWFKDTGWLWMNERSRTFYPQYLLGVSVGGVFLLVGSFILSPISSLYAAFLIPVVLLFVTYFRFKHPPYLELWRFLPLSLPSLFLVAAAFYSCWQAGKKWEVGCISFVIGMVVFFIFIPGIPKTLETQKYLGRLPQTRTSYICSIVAILAILGTLPPLVFFRAAFESEMVLFLNRQQVGLAQSLDARTARLRTEGFHLAGGEELLNSRLKPDLSRDVYQEFLNPCRMAGKGSKPPSLRFFGSMFKEVRVLLLFDSSAIETQGLSSNVDGALAVQMPPWWNPVSFKWLGVLLLLTAGLIAVAIGIARFIAKWIFMIDLLADRDPRLMHGPWLPFTTIWYNCSRGQRLALLGFASEGFINRKNPEVQSLLDAHILNPLPLKFVDEQFCKVVQERGLVDEDIVEGKPEAPSTWETIRWPLIAAAVGVCLFLFFNQRKMFDSGVGFLSTFGIAVAALLKLFDQFRGTRRPD